MEWMTRTGARLDRAAMIWLIRNRIDPAATISFLPEADVMAAAKERGATPFHHPQAELRNTGLRTGFDALVFGYELNDPAITAMALALREPRPMTVSSRRGPSGSARSRWASGPDTTTMRRSWPLSARSWTGSTCSAWS